MSADLRDPGAGETARAIGSEAASPPSAFEGEPIYAERRHRYVTGAMAGPSYIERLQEEASLALEHGHDHRAIQCLLELEKCDPANAVWPRRLAEIYRRHGLPQDEVGALSRAAQIYSQSGDLLRAIALSKQIIEIDPTHSETQRKLAELHAIPIVCGTPVEEASAGEDREAEALPARLEETLRALPDEPLETVLLSEIVPGAETATDEGVEELGMYEIPIVYGLKTLRTKPNEAGVDWSRSQDLYVQGFHTSTLDLTSQDIVRTPPPATDGLAKGATAVAEAAADTSAAKTARAVIPKTPLFSALSIESFHRLIDEARLVQLAPGQVLFRQGDVGDALYVVAEGSVRVLDEGPPRAELAVLREGDFFGEIALITQEPRNATIEAAEETRLLGVNRGVIHRLIERDAAVLTVLLKFLRDRLVERLMITHPLFRALGPTEREVFAKRFRFLEIDEGTALIEEGLRGKGLFILLAGRILVTRTIEDEAVRLAILRPGDLCGEISLITQKPAIATARAKSKCFAIDLPAGAFYKLMLMNPDAMAFVRRLAEQRIEEVNAILDGRAGYAEGRIFLV